MLPAPKIGMGFLRLLLNSGLLFLGATALTINRNSTSHHNLTDEDSFMYNVIPQHYDINLELFDTDRIIIDSECKVYIQIKHSTGIISFQADLSQMLKFEIHTLSSANNAQFNASKVYEAINYIYHEKDHTIFLFFDEEISSGFYILHLTFSNVEDGNSGSLFRTSYIDEVGNRMWIIATDFQAIGARKLFPCWDKPVFRTTFNISIKHHSDYMILSNMPIQKIHKSIKSTITWIVFEKTPLMPTYQVSAILMMHFSKISMDQASSIQLRRQLNSHILFAIDIINKVTEYFKSQGKCFQKFTEIKHVAIPGFLHDAVTNLGLIYYRETAILYKENDSVVRRTEIARLIGRALAYQCFDRTIPSQWSYMWLNEGIAMLLGMDAVDEAYPQFRIKDYFVVQIQQESLRFDTDSIMKPLISEINYPSDIDSLSYYLKAPVIMRMLQQILTNTVFRKGINMYLNKEAPLLGTTTPDDLWVAMQTAYDETSDYKERLNIKQIMDTWTKQQYYPVVDVIQRDFTFVRCMNIKKHWWLPYTIATEMDLDSFLSDHSQQPKMLNSSTFFFLYDTALYDTHKWIIVNTQQIGYYRVNYDAKSLLNIVRYLNSDEYAKIHVLNRAQIIDDAYYFLMKGQLDLSVFLKLARYLSQEKDYIAWYPMIKAFEYMSCFFPFPESTYIKNTMVEILDIVLKEIKHEYEKYEYERIEAGPIESLTEAAAKWACTLGSLKCRKKATTKLTTDLIKKKNCSSICVRMNEWFTSLCNGLKEQDSHSWDWVLKQYIENSDYTILKFLASNNFFNIRNNVDLIALCEKTQDDVRIYIFHYIVARHAKNDTTLNYILENFVKVKPRNISGTVALVDIINHVYSKEQLYKIAEVATNNLQYFTIRNKVFSIISKIEMRISQIMRQKNQFHNLAVFQTIPKRN